MKKAMVLGAGKSGISAKKILEKNRYEVLLVDDKLALPSKEGEKYLDEIEIFVKSPGVPYIGLVKEVQKRGIELIDEIELSYRELKKKSPMTKIIAVTGTNGKSTTVTKISEMLAYCGYRVAFCGNIGIPFGDVVMNEVNLDYIVLELSSFQLENLRDFKGDIVCVINLTPDHTDRYINNKEYYDIKFGVGLNQTKNDYFIMNLEDKESIERKDRIKGKTIGVSKNNKISSYVYAENGEIKVKGETIIKKEELLLKGEHNLENILFIICVGKLVGLKNEKIAEYLRVAKAIEHRLESFFKYGENEFINDSKGTNIESTNYAIDAYPGSILICGGKDKGLDLNLLSNKIIEKKIKLTLLMGENRLKLKESLLDCGYLEKNIIILETIDEVAKYLKGIIDKEKKDVVLFSPGTSSYDQFSNFEERGKKFKEKIIRYFGGES